MHAFRDHKFAGQLLPPLHAIDLRLGGFFARAIFLEFLHLANGFRLLLAQAEEFCFGALSALPGGEQFRVLERAALGNHSLTPGLFLGVGAGGPFLSETAFVTNFFESSIFGGTSRTSDHGTSRGTNRGARSGFSGLMANNATKHGSDGSTGARAALGMRRFTAGTAGGK